MVRLPASIPSSIIAPMMSKATTSAAAFSTRICQRGAGVLSRMSSVPCASSPATMPSANSTAYTARISGNMLNNLTPRKPSMVAN